MLRLCGLLWYRPCLWVVVGLDLWFGFGVVGFELVGCLGSGVDVVKISWFRVCCGFRDFVFGDIVAGLVGCLVGRVGSVFTVVGLWRVLI